MKSARKLKIIEVVHLIVGITSIKSATKIGVIMPVCPIGKVSSINNTV